MWRKQENEPRNMMKKQDFSTYESDEENAEMMEEDLLSEEIL
jgi:hypothetical protein